MVTFRVTLALIGLFVAATLGLLPYAHLAGPQMPGFNAAFAAGVCVAELATSFLLLVVLRQTLRPSVLLLAVAYLYSALMALAYPMAYPDAIAPGRLLVGGPQTISWIYNSWIFGFALMSFTAVLLELGYKGTIAPAQVRTLAYIGNALATALVAVLIVVYASQTERLPPLIVGNSWTPLNVGFNYGGVVLYTASVVLILLRLGPRNDLFLWLSLALVTIALGNLLAAAGGARYTLGWYACRLSWAASSAVLLLYFLGQFVRQHGQLVRTTGDLAERTRERDRIWSVSEDLLGISTFGGYFIALNPAWTRLLGWREDEVRHLHVDELRHPDDIERSRAGRARLAAGVPTVRMENRFRHKDGSWRWISWTMTADQGLIYVAGRDVTAEKEAQAALRKAEADAAHRQKMEALGQLTGGVAHDFNNLLMIVSGFIPRLRARAQGDTRAQEAVQAIEIAAQRGASLTRQLLSFARRQPINPTAIKVDEHLTALRTLLDGTVGSQIALTISATSDTWPVTVDANEFELAVLNLVLNARDAVAGDGAIALSARNVVLDGDETPEKLTGEFVAVCVADTGHGIAPEILGKVFDPFFTTKQADKGTGLGLSQVHGFTHQSGGTAVIDSPPGKGTVVTLYLPRTQAVAEAAPAERAESAPGGMALLVEDNAEVAEVAREMLSQLGYTVRLAADVRAALGAIGREPFDLVVSDIVMPGSMNGVELAQTIRADKPNLPILLVTGYAGSAGESPDFPVLRKPYRFEQMRQAIADLLGKRPRRELALDQD
ncbi:MAG: MASE4 domain-containing protein [Reyranella sp.]|nr:MASE4 domain-containing protein [Reyranella sp.]MBN9088681.1 MASE4 domain-containing protein [Reyranella sp.]